MKQHIQNTCTKKNLTTNVSHSPAVLAILARRMVLQKDDEDVGYARPHTATNGDVETKPVWSALMAT